MFCLSSQLQLGYPASSTLFLSGVSIFYLGGDDTAPALNHRCCQLPSPVFIEGILCLLMSW